MVEEIRLSSPQSPSNARSAVWSISVKNANRQNCSATTWKRKGFLLVSLCVLISAPALSSCKKKTETANSTELCSVAYRGDDILIRSFLQKGANVNIRDNNGCTPITVAVGGGHLSTVKLLIENGADVNAPCNSGANPLFIAADRGQGNILRLLLDNGADVNRTDSMGGSALMHAINRGHTDIVRDLLEKGAEVNLRLKYGETPLILAVKKENEAVVKLLLEKGADVRATAHNEMSSLQFAIEKGNAGIAQLLIDKGADVNLRASDGYTPMTLARSNKLDKIVALLQAAGVREPVDNFHAAAAEYREKQEKARREIEKKGLEFLVTDANVQFYVKPASIRKIGNDTCQATIWEYYFDIDELNEISMELNCAERTYRHLSNVLLDLTGKVLQVTPVDSYTLHDAGNIQNGTFMHRILMRVCGGK
jgi:ankyrin repeat protein